MVFDVIKYPSGVSDLHNLMVEGLGYYVSKDYSKMNLMTWSYAMLIMGVCPSHHSPNDMILLLITSDVHDQETMIIY